MCNFNAKIKTPKDYERVAIIFSHIRFGKSHKRFKFK